MRFNWRAGLDVVGVVGGVMAIEQINTVATVLGVIASIICSVAVITRFVAKVAATVSKWRHGKITTEQAAEELTDAANKLESEAKENGKCD